MRNCTFLQLLELFTCNVFDFLFQNYTLLQLICCNYEKLHLIKMYKKFARNYTLQKLKFKSFVILIYFMLMTNEFCLKNYYMYKVGFNYIIRKFKFEILLKRV